MAQQLQGPTAEELAARTPGEFWESLYRERAHGGAAWGTRVNPVLEEVAVGLPPGTALDLAGACARAGPHRLPSCGHQVLLVAVPLAERGRTAAGGPARGGGLEQRPGVVRSPRP